MRYHITDMKVLGVLNDSLAFGAEKIMSLVRRRTHSSQPSFLQKVYKNQTEIADGAFGKVFEAYSPTHGCTVAIKQVYLKHKPAVKFAWPISRLKLRNDSGANEELKVRRISRKQAEKELMIWKRMNKFAYIITLYDSLDFKTELWFVMERCTPLISFLDNFDPETRLLPPMSIIKEIFAGIFLALREMHRQGIIHRDVKDENIVLTITKEAIFPKLIDFGMCKVFKNEDGTRKKLVSGESGFGTYYTAPPEAYFPGSPYNESADMYSLCLTMLTSRYNRRCWTLSKRRAFDSYYSLKKHVYSRCKHYLDRGESIEFVEDTYLVAARIAPSEFIFLREEYDPYPWTESRLQFSNFAREHMRWDVNVRATVEDACEHSYMKDVIQQWESDALMAAANLITLIEDFKCSELPVEKKRLMF